MGLVAPCMCRRFRTSQGIQKLFPINQRLIVNVHLPIGASEESLVDMQECSNVIGLVFWSAALRGTKRKGAKGG
jgi:hypothetical protein